MPSVDEITAEILRREGGYVNDPDDPGGPTNHGVTLGTMRRLGIDLDGDGVIDTSDVRALSRERAADIYKHHYFGKPGIAALPDMVQASVYDMYVNAGGNAVKILQRLMGEFGVPVTVDGAIGPMTRRAAAEVARIAPGHFADAYGIARRNYYYRLADKRPASRKFARRRDGGKGGWILRAEAFISARWHLSAGEHNARVAAWG